MKKTLLLGLILFQVALGFDLLGSFNIFKDKKEDIPKEKFEQLSTGLMLYFEPKRAEFHLPSCLRNIADIIEDVEKLYADNSLEFTIEKVIQKTAKYSEMLFSCGFAFQYQMFFKLFNVMNTEQNNNGQGTCGRSSNSHSCGQINIKAQDEDVQRESSFFEKIKPCVLRIKDISLHYFTSNNTSSQTSKFEEIKIVFEQIRFVEECQFQVITTLLDTSRPCIQSFDKFILQFNEIKQSSSFYLGFIYQGPTLISAISEIISVCKDPFISLIYPFNNNNN